MRRMTTAATMVAMLLTSAAAWADQDDELARLRQENAQLRAQNAELQRQLQNLREQLLQARSANVQLQQQTATLHDQTRQLQVERDELSVLAAITPAEEITADTAARIRVSYDDQADRTRVMSPSVKAVIDRGNRADTFLTVAYSHEGRTLAAPPQSFILYVQTAGSGGEYRGVSHLGLTIDGQRVDVPVTDYRSVLRRTTGVNRSFRRDDETLTLTVPLDVARRVAAARAVQAQLGHTRFAMNRDHLASFRALVRRLETVDANPR